MSKVEKIFYVSLKVNLNGDPDDMYFSSKKAIFDYFGDRLGIKTLNKSNLDKVPYENSVCVIRMGYLKRAKISK